MLRSANGQFTLEVLLNRISDQSHSGWLAYSLVLSADQNGEYRFASTDDCPLFLDCEIEPEIPALCAALRAVATEGGDYCFEPIDDRDFSLHVTVDGDKCTVKMEVPDKPIPASIGWASGVPVEVAELLRFADELESHYETVMQ